MSRFQSEIFIEFFGSLANWEMNRPWLINQKYEVISPVLSQQFPQENSEALNQKMSYFPSPNLYLCEIQTEVTEWALTESYQSHCHTMVISLPNKVVARTFVCNHITYSLYLIHASGYLTCSNGKGQLPLINWKIWHLYNKEL